MISRGLSTGLHCASVALAVVLTSGIAQAATIQVRIRHISTKFVFDPTNLVINAGDTVRWTNAAPIAHDSTHASGTPLWSSPLLSPTQTFPFRFDNPGTYPYFCRTHIATHPEQTGTVTVVTANLRPTVAITNPPNNSVFLAPASFDLIARASDSDGSVTQVRFFNGNTLLGSSTTAPYTQPINNLAAGQYAFTARATDNGGLVATSAVRNVTVVTPIQLTDPRLGAGGRFRFDYSADTGETYVVWASPANGLLPLISLRTNVATNAVMSFVDTNPPPVSRIYSVERIP